MDEYLYPITVEGDWGPEHAKSVKNKLQIYFQSKKKSQGGDCVTQYNDGSNSATILFKSSGSQDSVLLKAEHFITIDNQQIKLKVYKPSDDKQADNRGQCMKQACGNQEPNQSAPETELNVKKPRGSSAVVLENLPDDVQQDVLTILVQNISSLSENDFRLELRRKVVVTFNNSSAADKFLEDSRKNEKLKQYNLRARALERSTCVRVEDLPAEANNNKMLLELNFEKWGGPVEEVITIPAEQAAIIIFKEEEAKERALRQEYNICGVPVKIYPYFKSLDTVLYEWPVSHPLQSKVESDIKKVVKDHVFTYMDSSKGVMTLAGMTHKIIELKPIMEKILERATNQMEREKNTVTEYMEISPAVYSLLEQDGLKNASTVSPDLHIEYNKKNKRLILSGLRIETLTFKNLVLEKQINMKQKPLQINRSILEFLRSVDCDEMSRDLFISHGITAVYTIENGDVFVIGSTERALAEAEKRVNMVLASKDLTVEDQGVLQMPQWQNLKKQLQELFNNSKKTSVSIHLSQRDKVTVTGFREQVMEVSESLRSFMKKYAGIEEIINVKSHAAVEFIKDRKSQDWQHFMKSDKMKVNFDSKRPWIKLSGERTFVQPALTFFQSLADALYTDMLIIKKTGAKKFFREQGKMLWKEKRFVVVLQEDEILEKGKDYLFQDFLKRSSESPTNEEFVILDEEIKPVVFQLCGETPKDLSEAKDMINNLILREHVTIPIHDPAIVHFTREDGETLNAMQRELTVSVRLEKKGQDSVITLEGLTRDVHTAESRIRDMIRKVERNENRRREAFIISSIVQWKYQENGRNFKNLNMLTNYDLEKAYQRKLPTVKIKINNDEYEADLVKKEAKRRGITIELNRVDLQAAAQSPLPSHWEDMKGQPVVLVKLTPGSKEHAEVEKEFRRTNLTNNIIEIERVQNIPLWKDYMIKKKELEDKNNHKNTEKYLFHGTGPDKTERINNYGFNRSFTGTNGALYGNGTYFAVYPQYSAPGYFKPDAKGHKRMYLVRVLVGEYTQGKQGLLVPPAKSSNSFDLYNSVTDNIYNPTMFVIFNDVQAYPEYLITFQ